MDDRSVDATSADRCESLLVKAKVSKALHSSNVSSKGHSLDYIVESSRSSVPLLILCVSL
jgi:hypothetical protein